MFASLEDNVESADPEPAQGFNMSEASLSVNGNTRRLRVSLEQIIGEMSRSSSAPTVDSDDESHTQTHRQSKLYELHLRSRDSPSTVRVHMLDIQMNNIDSHLLLLTDLTHEIE